MLLQICTVIVILSVAFHDVDCSKAEAKKEEEMDRRYEAVENATCAEPTISEEKVKAVLMCEPLAKYTVSILSF